MASFDRKNNLTWDSQIDMPKPPIGGDSGPGGLALNTTEDRLFVTLTRNNTLAVINLADKSVREIPVGMAPYGVLLTSDFKAYVTNWGGRRPIQGESTYNSSGRFNVISGKRAYKKETRLPFWAGTLPTGPSRFWPSPVMAVSLFLFCRILILKMSSISSSTPSPYSCLQPIHFLINLTAQKWRESEEWSA